MFWNRRKKITIRVREINGCPTLQYSSDLDDESVKTVQALFCENEKLKSESAQAQKQVKELQVEIGRLKERVQQLYARNDELIDITKRAGK